MNAINFNNVAYTEASLSELERTRHSQEQMMEDWDNEQTDKD